MTSGQDTLRVFISYARRDAAAFAEELVAGLEVAGFEAFLDKHDIAGGEDWEARLGGLIESADTIVFVVTPASVASERCQWEVDRATALSKRIVPVVFIPVEEAATPTSLRRLNYIFFGEGHSFSRSLGVLAQALRVDLGWIREHTRLSDVARRWDGRERNEVLLLRGPELEGARAWLAGWRSPAPEPTDLQRALIAASEEAEGAIVRRERARQRRTLMRVGAAAVLFALLAVVSGWFWFRSVQSEAEMFRAMEFAQEQRHVANQTAARAQFYEGLYWLRLSVDAEEQSESRSRAERAIQAFDQGLEQLGNNDVEMDGVSLRDMLQFGRRFVLYCAGLGMAVDGPRPDPAIVERFYQSFDLSQCRR